MLKRTFFVFAAEYDELSHFLTRAERTKALIEILLVGIKEDLGRCDTGHFHQHISDYVWRHISPFTKLRIRNIRNEKYRSQLIVKAIGSERIILAFHLEITSFPYGRI